ncbi:MAG: hypothetical protein PQJ61_01945 [Spirochaetales bacterium]|uniref:Uncharacterized protein n=1 Tax=Candidatus Thalassospirochaeta sargassi TaxID=3119039 RepID=A0AAJ1IA67_9SPIO|nr:hypothetical protein [Spirochaetales bacterium]
MMKRLVPALFITAALCSGCGNNPPELKQIYNQINFINTPGSDTVLAEMVVYINTDDEDGSDDIISMNVIHEKSELYWTADSDSWIERDSRGMKWSGSHHISMPDGGLLPAGEYRVLITDKAGERDEDTIFVPLIKNVPDVRSFPEIMFADEGTFELKSPESGNTISFYDPAGRLLGAYRATAGLVNIESLRDGTSVLKKYRTVTAAYYNNRIGAGIVSGPYARPENSK